MFEIGPVPPLSALCVPDGTGPVFPLYIRLPRLPLHHAPFLRRVCRRSILPRSAAAADTAGLMLTTRPLSGSGDSVFKERFVNVRQNFCRKTVDLAIDSRSVFLYNVFGILALHKSPSVPLLRSPGDGSDGNTPAPAEGGRQPTRPARLLGELCLLCLHYSIVF